MNIMESEQLLSIRQEIDHWKRINNHPNIVRLIDFEVSKTTALILMELCAEGTLLEQINNRADKIINEKQVLYIIKEIASGLNHMHTQNVPIAHRDIKIENILRIGNNYKLCDFGSASVDTLDPRKEDKNKILENFSKYERMTTFIYRAPEMCDPYSKHPINEKVDMWMLGCILYAILFQKHPFQDAQKLTIINAHYYIPDEHVSYSEKIVDFMRLMLTPNPVNRPSAKTILNLISNWDSLKYIELPSETKEIKDKQLRNAKTKNMTFLTDDDIQRVQAQILKDQKKKNKNKFKKQGKINLIMIDDYDDEYLDEVFEDLEVNENYKVEQVSKEKGGDNGIRNNRGGNFINNNENLNLSKSPIRTIENSNPNKNYNKNFDGFKNNEISSSKPDWMLDFSNNITNNNKNYSGFEDNGFDFDFVNTSNNSKNTFRKPSTGSVKEIKDEFEDFVFTSSTTPNNTEKTNSAKTNNIGYGNLLDLSNSNKYNNNQRDIYHNNPSQVSNGQFVNQQNVNQNYAYNNSYNYNNNNQNINSFAYNPTTNVQNNYKPVQTPQLNHSFNNNLYKPGMNMIPNGMAGNPSQIQINPIKKSNEQNIHDFFK